MSKAETKFLPSTATRSGKGERKEGGVGVVRGSCARGKSEARVDHAGWWDYGLHIP